MAETDKTGKNPSKVVSTTSSMVGSFYTPSQFTMAKRTFNKSIIAKTIRKYPYFTTGLIFCASGSLFISATATTFATGADPLIIAAGSASLIASSCLAMIGLNKLAKTILKDRYPDAIFNRVNNYLGLSVSTFFLAASGCFMASPTATLIYPAIGFTLASLLFLGTNFHKTFPKVGDHIKAKTGFNPLKFFVKHPGEAIGAAGVAVVVSRGVVPAIDPSQSINFFGVGGGVVSIVLGTVIAIIAAPTQAKNNVLNNIGSINALLERSGKDLSNFVTCDEKGRFKAVDAKTPHAKEIARKLNSTYRQIYSNQNEKSFAQLKIAASVKDGMESATELLSCKHLTPYETADGKAINDGKTVQDIKNNSIKAAQKSAEKQGKSWLASYIKSTGNSSQKMIHA